MDEQQTVEPPKLKPNCYVFVASSALPVLDTFDELAEKLDDAPPDEWIEITVNVQQPEVAQHGDHPLFSLVGIRSRDGFTRARYRARLFNGYCQVLPPEVEHGE